MSQLLSPVKRHPKFLDIALPMIVTIVLLLGLALPTSSQSINLNLVKTNLAVVAGELQRQAPKVKFSFDPDALEKIKVDRVVVRAERLREALVILQQQYGLEYLFKAENVTLKYNLSTKTAIGKPGTIRGRVVDFETSQPLPDATVTVVEARKSLACDQKGYFVFKNLLPGSYTLSISYSGYTVSTVSDIILKEDQEIVQDIRMTASNTLNEVVVNSSRARVKAVTFSTEKEMIADIRNARAVVSGISSEQISKTADRNAAEIVKRIAGVTVTDDRFIVVRGMNQRYNLTYLNGNLAPATELYSRAFAYDLLPSPIIDKILVYKSPSPDVLGDFAGGVVKVFTKNAKPVRHIDIGFQGGYREGSSFHTINSYPGGRQDWLGFDDGKRRLPNIIRELNGGGISQTDQEKIITAFNPKLNYDRQQAPADFQGFISYFDNFSIGKARVFSLTSLTYTRETRFYHIDRQTGNTSNGTGRFTEYNQIGKEDQTNQIGKVNALQNFTIVLDKNNRLHFNNFFLDEGRQQTFVRVSRNNISLDQQNWERLKRIAIGFQQRLLYSGNLDGEHQLNKNMLHWNLGYQTTAQYQPDQRISNFFSIENGFTGSDSLVPKSNSTFIAGGSNRGGGNDMFLGMISRLFAENKEKLYSGSLEYSFSIHPAFKLKAGTYHFFRSRNVDRHFLKVNRAGLNGNEGSLIYDAPGTAEGFGYNNPSLLRYNQDDLDNVWSAAYFRNDKTGLALYDVTSPVDRYVASEQNNSGFIMGELSALKNKLILSGGLRLEYDVQKVSGSYAFEGLIVPLLVYQPKTAWMPSLNATYTVDSNLVVRAGAGKSINRPDFREITPANDFDFSENQQIRGNPTTVSADIYSYDLRFEWYPRNQRNESMSLGAFYKKLRHPIERVRRDLDSYGDGNSFAQISYSNADEAKVLGLEAEIRKSLVFIPGKLFRRLSFIGNLALIDSKVSNDSSGVYNANNFRDRPLQGQAPYVVNAGLYYDNPGSGTKLSVTYTVSGPTIYATSSKVPKDSSISQIIVRPSLLELPRHLIDISASQRLVKNLQVKFILQNLFNQPFQIIEDQNSNSRYDAEQQLPDKSYVGDNLFTRFNTGRYYTVTFTYSF